MAATYGAEESYYYGRHLKGESKVAMECSTPVRQYRTAKMVEWMAGRFQETIQDQGVRIT